MPTKNHPLLGEKIDYNKLNPKQQESYNLQKISSVFAEYGYLVIKLSDDWNDADFIALEFGKDNYLKVQLKGRFGFWKKYLGKNLSICFCDQDSKSWYLYPHDELCEITMKKRENTVSWKEKGEYHFPTISEDDKEILRKYKITEETQKEILEDSQKDYSSDSRGLKKNRKKDTTKYQLNGQPPDGLGKGRLVLEVIKSYIKENPNVTLEKLQDIFPKGLQGNIGVIDTRENAKTKYKDERHFTKKEEVIELKTGDKIVICTEWGIGNINKLIDKAKELGFDILKKEVNNI